MHPSKTCQDCTHQFTPRRSIDVRCPDCAKKRRVTGSATRASRKPGSPKNERHRIKKEDELKARIRGRSYIGLDGEGGNEPSNWYDEYWEEGDPVTDRHRYKLMQAARRKNGQIVERYALHPQPGKARLRTQDILWWLWKITAKTTEEIEAGDKLPSLWFYSSKYDWTHILIDIAIEAPEIMHALFHPPVDDPFKKVWWRGWGISYVQASVEITRRWRDKTTGELVYAKRTMFFQDGFKCWGGGSFVSQLKSWKVGTPEQVERIEGMKEKRARFSDITPEIEAYCQEEVDLLAELAEKITIIASELGIRPDKVYSAGSYAKAMLRTHNIAADPKTGWEGYRGPDRYAGADDRIVDILMRTFFGGWFDLFETGLFDVLYMIDLASAYPSVIRDLPCLSHGHWEEGRSAHPRALTFGHVSWEPNHEGGSKIGPFPWRYPDGRTYRPEIGEGWYVGELIDAAERLGRFDIDQHEWVSFVPDCDHEPFLWVQDVYEERLRLGKDGAGLVLKVSLNSVYGTFADTLALDSRYASIVWASTITGRTQAKLLDVCTDHYDDVVGVATDGVQAKKPLPVQATPKALGGWDDEGEIRDVLAVQPGLYLAAEGESPKKMARSRGHALKDMRAIEADLRAAWERDGWRGVVEYQRTRLIPAKLALGRKDTMAVYGQWVEEAVKIKFVPTYRDPIEVPGKSKLSELTHRHLYDPKIAGTDLELSAPYNRLVAMILRQALIDLKELEDGQP